LFHLLSSLETDASSEFVIFIAVNTTFTIQKHHAFFDVIFVYTFNAALFLLVESDYMIKFEASVALSDATVFFKQFA